MDFLHELYGRFARLEPEECSGSIKNSEAEAFLRANAPRFACSDETLTEIFAFRLWTYRKHLKRTPEGFVITEFLPDVPWAGPYNAIVCPVGHHINEGRWLSDRTYIKDDIRHFTRGAGREAVFGYQNDLIYAACEYVLSFDDLAFGAEIADDLLRIYRTWWETHGTSYGLLWCVDNYDGMEYSISGNGLRPTLNAYMYGAATGLAALFDRLGRREEAQTLRSEAEALKERINRYLWDARDGFYKTVPMDARTDTPDFARQNAAHNVRELIGYIPFAYAGLTGTDKDTAFAALTDPTCFLAPYGPTTADRSHPGFRKTDSDHECLWDGPSWPFATAQTLSAVIRRREEGEIPTFTDADFVRALKTYANSHYIVRDGVRVPWIDEDLDPDTGEWVARRILHEIGDPHRERGIWYNHSSFCDLVIRGLCGVRPCGDHLELSPMLSPDITWFMLENLSLFGKTYAVYYDADGTHLGRGRGLFTVET